MILFKTNIVNPQKYLPPAISNSDSMYPASGQKPPAASTAVLNTLKVVGEMYFNVEND